MAQAVSKDTTSCKEAGKLRPIVDQTRCEGANECVVVCPYDVFEVRKLTKTERKALPMLVQLKVTVHGGKQAFVVRAEDCHSCGLCVEACPEKAIKLTRYQ